jgi:hypothetical protein
VISGNGVGTRTRARALTAAARSLSGPGGLSITLLNRAMQAAQSWQNAAWGYFDDIPEVHFAHDFLGNCCASIRLFPQIQLNPTDPPVPLDPDDENLDGDVRKAAAVAAATLDRLDSSIGGVGGLQAALGLNAALVGEVYLWGHVDDEASTGESWEAISTREVRVSGETIQILGEGATAGDQTSDLDPLRDHFIRIWRRHPAHRLRADSPMRSLAATCDELLLLTRSVRAVATSRLAGAGILKVPDELSFVSPSIDGGEPPEDGDPLLETLLVNMTTPIADPDSAAAVVPLMVKGPAEALREMSHLLIERPFDPMAMQLREEAVTRLARGLDLPPEILLGLADSNHWTAWQIEEQTYKAHVENLVALITEGLTVGFLQPILRDVGIAQWNQISIGADPSALIGHPNEFPEALQMHTAMAVSDAYLRSKGGAGDEDEPDPEEIARRLAMKQALPPDVTAALLQLAEILPVLQEIVSTEPIPEPPAEPEQEAPASPETVEPGPPEEEGVTAAAARGHLGARLAALDRALLARILALAEGTVQRAVEMTGARILRSLGNAQQYEADRRLVHAVALDRAAAVLGPDRVRALGVREDEIMNKHLAGAEAAFLAAISRTRQQARRIVSEELGPTPDDFDDEMWDEQQEDNDRNAWGLLFAGLTLVATSSLYDPRPTAPPIGEMPVEARVPPTLVRESVATAGGKSASPNVRPAGAPEGGVALGDSLLDLLHDAYHQTIEGWRWIYGDPSARTRPFEPHYELDGKEFSSWDADVLYNPEPFPPADFFAPGDHDGCLCDFEVVLVATGESE